MGTSQLIISGVASMVAYAALVLAIFKIFSISSDVAQIKEMLKDVKRNTEERFPEPLPLARNRPQP